MLCQWQKEGALERRMAAAHDLATTDSTEDSGGTDTIHSCSTNTDDDLLVDLFGASCFPLG